MGRSALYTGRPFPFYPSAGLIKEENKSMKRRICCFVWLFLLLGTVAAQEKVVKLKIVQTSDIHGNYYPHDFILQKDAVGSLAREDMDAAMKAISDAYSSVKDENKKYTPKKYIK